MTATIRESEASRRRVGLYGGSFNPVHFGHLRTAIEVLEQAELAEVWLVPVHVPPHKENEALAPGAARLRMLELAVQGNPNLRACDLELGRAGPSYTIDTVRLVKDQHPELDLSLILGFDAFREIHTWKEYEQLFAACDLLVTSRPPYEVRAGEDFVHFGKLPIAVTRSFCYDEHLRCYAHDSGHRLRFVPVTAIDISASRVREAAQSGRSIAFLTPDSVAQHISREGLYLRPPSSTS